MVVSISIRDDIARVQKRLTAIEKKQIPFAVAGAINATLFEVRKHIVGKTAPAAFEVRNKRFMTTALRVEKANKRKLTGALFDRLGFASLALHAKGGTKRARSGRLAIPLEFVAGKRKRSGKIPERLKPKQLLEAPGPRGRKAFVITFKSGQEAIVRRKTKKRLPLQVLYLFESSARIKKTFRFFEDATAVSRRALPIQFRKAFRRAMATAR